nr:hypothetical protein [Candidatus Freyarchaeota archaeon]
MKGETVVIFIIAVLAAVLSVVAFNLPFIVRGLTPIFLPNLDFRIWIIFTQLSDWSEYRPLLYLSTVLIVCGSLLSLRKEKNLKVIGANFFSYALILNIVLGFTYFSKVNFSYEVSNILYLLLDTNIIVGFNELYYSIWFSSIIVLGFLDMEITFNFMVLAISIVFGSSLGILSEKILKGPPEDENKTKRKINRATRKRK